MSCGQAGTLATIARLARLLLLLLSLHSPTAHAPPKTVAVPAANRSSFHFVGVPHCNDTSVIVDYAAHREDVSGVILYAYILKNNTLVPNGVQKGFAPDICTGRMEQWRQQVAPIYAAIAAQDPVSPDKEAQFIAAAVANAKKYKLSGYNMDRERKGRGPPGYLNFLEKFASALHEEGMALTSDVNDCPQGLEGISCAQYKASSVDQVLLMSWYTGDTSQRFLNKVAATRDSLGAAKVMAGWRDDDAREHHHNWMRDCSVMDFVLNSGIGSVGYWADDVTPHNWQLLHEFLTVDPRAPPPASNRTCGTPPAPGPPAPPPPCPSPPAPTPLERIHHGLLCLSAPSITQRGPVTLQPCEGGGGGGDTGQAWQWSNQLRCLHVNHTQFCATAVSAWAGHMACEQLRLRHGTAPIALSKSTRGGGLRFDQATGTLRLEGCDGACAGAANINITSSSGSSWTRAGNDMVLVDCTDPRAAGFSLSPF